MGRPGTKERMRWDGMETRIQRWRNGRRMGRYSTRANRVRTKCRGLGKSRTSKGEARPEKQNNGERIKGASDGERTGVAKAGDGGKGEKGGPQIAAGATSERRRAPSSADERAGKTSGKKYRRAVLVETSSLARGRGGEETRRSQEPGAELSHTKRESSVLDPRDARARVPRGEKKALGWLSGATSMGEREGETKAVGALGAAWRTASQRCVSGVAWRKAAPPRTVARRPTSGPGEEGRGGVGGTDGLGPTMRPRDGWSQTWAKKVPAAAATVRRRVGERSVERGGSATKRSLENGRRLSSRDEARPGARAWARH